MIAYKIAFESNMISQSEYSQFCIEMHELPDKIESILNFDNDIRDICKKYYNVKSLLCIGRGILEIISYETALKIKEVSYIHAEGYSASELKHGSLALISREIPTIVFMQSGQLAVKTLSNMQEIKSRFGQVIIVCENEMSDIVSKSTDDYIIVPSGNNEYINSILFLIIGQMFAYHLADLLERPIDRPRNLSKSLTVE